METLAFSRTACLRSSACAVAFLAETHLATAVRFLRLCLTVNCRYLGDIFFRQFIVLQSVDRIQTVLAPAPF